MTLRRGMVVSVDFWDHVQNARRPVRCTAYGRLDRVWRNTLVLVTWDAHMRAERDQERNTERYVIVRSAVIGVTVYCKAGDVG